MSSINCRINYRKEYEKLYGTIPKDQNGRSYEIHHIDGNHSNNNPSNWKLVTIEEHYQIHKSQKDWGACLAMAMRMKISPEEHSLIAKLTGQKTMRRRVNEGTCPFQKHNNKLIGTGFYSKNATEMNKKRIENKTHNFLVSNLSKKLIAEGRHPTQNQLSLNKAKITRKNTINKKKELGLYRPPNNSIQIFTCPHCSKKGRGFIMFRHHFHNCKLKKDQE